MNQKQEHIQRLLELCRELIDLAVAGSEASDDAGSLLLYGMVQDCAYKMRKIANEELELRKRRRTQSDQALPGDKGECS